MAEQRGEGRCGKYQRGAGAVLGVRHTHHLLAVRHLNAGAISLGETGRAPAGAGQVWCQHPAVSLRYVDNWATAWEMSFADWRALIASPRTRLKASLNGRTSEASSRTEKPTRFSVKTTSGSAWSGNPRMGKFVPEAGCAPAGNGNPCMVMLGR